MIWCSSLLFIAVTASAQRWCRRADRISSRTPGAKSSGRDGPTSLTARRRLSTASDSARNTSGGSPWRTPTATLPGHPSVPPDAPIGSRFRGAPQGAGSDSEAPLKAPGQIHVASGVAPSA